MSGVTLVCFAVPQEAKPFRSVAGRREDVRVVVTGMGHRNARKAVADALNRFTPRRVFTCGFAGALDPALRIGDVVFNQANTPEPVAAALLKQKARPVKFDCGDRVAVTANEKSALRSSTQAAAIEMESAVVHEVCNARGVECITVRAISDVADQDLPLDFNALMNANDRLSGVRLAMAVLKAPHRIPALIRLGMDSTRAARELADVLRALIELP
jgi:adenosylhomocysteine nucleosidase